MSVRSALTRLAIATAGGVLAATATVTPAVAMTPAVAGGAPAGDDPGPSRQNATISRAEVVDPWVAPGDQGDPRRYKGVVTARGGLLLRSRPDRGGQVIGRAAEGAIVSIFCKYGGETVDGNPLWYLLTDGTWAWGAARYIDNIGSAPRWC
ncbi:SH3 domain-containing protein [Streptomyces sp. NPDC059582]|uniref:SH3 domain-containing protein n=1 Tax=Streptomyces sp. NPDC059582 TaxID=3346875 RepID=UPI0036AE8094